MTERILVTGAGGFIGAQVVHALEASGADVHLVSSSRTPARPDANLVSHSCDLLDPSARRQLIADVRPSHLVHLAWVTGHGTYWNDPTNADWVAASVDLFRLFEQAGGHRIVAAGTCAEYDWQPPGPYREDSPARPATLYGIAKLATGTVGIGLASRSSLSFCWARLFHLYGPGEHGQRLVPALTRQALGGAVPTPQKTDSVIDLMHVADAGRALAALADSGVEGAVNVASGQPVRLGDLALRVAEASGIATELPRVRQNDGQSITADITRLQIEAGFGVTVALTDGLVEAREWWRSRATEGKS